MLTDVLGEAWYQFGEMRLRVGDEDKAEEAFQEALARGREPVPGYAVLLARRGDVASGIDLLERTLRAPGMTPWARARLLPPLIQLALEAGEVDKASKAVDELTEIGSLARSELFTAQARAGMGRIAVARGEPGSAIEALKSALAGFTAIGLPFEAALVHADLARAYRADGAQTLADIEMKTAVSELDRLGAAPQTLLVDGTA
jgi:tetratricopeptide (TPR) repeat protein